MNTFFQLIHISLGRKDSFDAAPTEEQWKELFETARKQALLGVTYAAVERLPKEQRPPKAILVNWYLLTEKIEKANENLNRLALALQERFAKHDFRSCLLKGQGVAAYYPAPLRRKSGDIDIWVEGGRDRVAAFCLSITPGQEVVYHHMDFPVTKGTPIEVHFMPSWMYNPITNSRLQRWFHSQEEACFAAQPNAKTCLIAPPTAFNMVYILLHIYRHVVDEGVGLRQLLDYYYVLLHRDRTLDADVLCTLKSLHMRRIAAAVMYVLREVCGLPEADMLLPPAEKEGQFLLKEIMLSGNFGAFNPRGHSKETDTPWQHFRLRQGRKMRYLWSYPSEIIWSPIFSVWQFFWRRRKGYFSKKQSKSNA